MRVLIQALIERRIVGLLVELTIHRHPLTHALDGGPRDGERTWGLRDAWQILPSRRSQGSVPMRNDLITIYGTPPQMTSHD